jgi:hypothetical protein
LFLFIIKHHHMKLYGEMEVQLHTFLASVLVEVSGQLHTPAALLPWEDPLIPIGWEARWAPELVWLW